MIIVWGGGASRSIRAIWILEEMGLSYCVRHVNMLATVKDPAWLAINPGDFLPAIQDGEVTMVESVAIMEYLMGRYGPTPLQPSPDDPVFPAYQHFLHLGEAGLATLMMVPLVSGFVAPEAERDNWGARWARECVEQRLLLVRRQLAVAPYMAGDRFTGADISVTYALNLGANHAGSSSATWNRPILPAPQAGTPTSALSIARMTAGQRRPATSTLSGTSRCTSFRPGSTCRTAGCTRMNGRLLQGRRQGRRNDQILVIDASPANQETLRRHA